MKKRKEDSSGYSDSSVPLYRASLALHWLPILHIALSWLPALNIALVWLQTTRFFITRAPNLVTRLDVELHPLHRLHALAPSPTYGPTPTPYTGSLHPVQGPNIDIRSLRAS